MVRIEDIGEYQVIEVTGKIPDFYGEYSIMDIDTNSLIALAILAIGALLILRK